MDTGPTQRVCIGPTSVALAWRGRLVPHISASTFGPTQAAAPVQQRWVEASQHCSCARQTQLVQEQFWVGGGQATGGLG